MKHTVSRKQSNSRFCFVCGLENQFGLKARFYETEHGDLIGLFHPAAEHQGYPGRLHGGMISTILDEVLARAINVGAETETWGVTVDLQVKFLKPIPIDQECRVIGRVTVDKRRYFESSGEIILAGGELAASATARFVKLDLARIGAGDLENLQWQVVADDHDPTIIEF